MRPGFTVALFVQMKFWQGLRETRIVLACTHFLKIQSEPNAFSPSSALGRMTRMPVIVHSIIDCLKEMSKLIPEGIAYRKISNVDTL